MAQSRLEEVQASRDLPRDIVRTKLEEAIAIADGMLATPKLSRPEYRIATLAKAMALELMAERVESDPDRRVPLLVESSRYSAPIAEHVNGKPPAAKRLNARQAEEFEWGYVSRWTRTLIDQGELGHALLMAGDYASSRPSYYRAHAQHGEVYLRLADAAKDDPKRRQDNLNRALGPLQRVISLTPTEVEREKAFSALIDVLGPARLNQPAFIEEASRTMIQRYPADAGPRATLAIAQFRARKLDEADATIAAVSASAAKRAALRVGVAERLAKFLLSGESLPPATVSRVASAADRLLTEAEKLTPDHPDVLQARQLVDRATGLRKKKD